MCANLKSEPNTVENEELVEAFEKGKEKLERLDRDSSKAQKLKVNSPSYKHRKLFVSSAKSKNVTSLGALMDAAAKYLIGKHPELSDLMHLNISESIELAEYCRSKDKFHCSQSKYRTYDGTCNNLVHPGDWGVALKPFKRLLPPDYCDAWSEPRCGKGSLPSARDVTLQLHRANYTTDYHFTFMFAVWGQFVDHGITATALTLRPTEEMLSCCGAHRSPECYSVELSQEDPFYHLHNITCMEFLRSAPSPTCSLGPRQQLNQVSSFMDGSAVYGDSIEKANSLRSYQGGKLKMFTTSAGHELLPISTDPFDGCNRKEEMAKGRYCFESGDSRANENTHLTTLHLIMARHHNQIATKLSQVNPNWEDEILYQEARRILVAQLQHITYNEFLEPLMGSQNMEKYDLRLRQTGYYEGYNNSVDPTISNNFATAAFRFAHTLLPGLMKSYERISEANVVHLRKILFNPFPLYTSGGVERVLLSAIGTNIEKNDRFFTKEVTEHLFEDTSDEKPMNHFGLDLVSLNIQRGRDHGLPGYTKWRAYCGLSSIESFEELLHEVDEESVDAMKRLYKSVDEIDLYSGALSERPMDQAILGPTAACLVGEQFQRLRQGDRYWYETNESPQAFTQGQLNEIRKTTFAKIICNTAEELEEVPQEVMKFPSTWNQNVKCSELEDVNIGYWMDEKM